MKSNADIYERLYSETIQKDEKAWGGNQWKDRIKKWESSLEKLLNHPLFPKRGNILELGSGLGNISRYFALRGYSVTGIEISPTAVHNANRIVEAENLNAHFFEGNVADLSRFQNQSFDAAIDGNCLHCLIGNERSEMMSEVFRVLKSGGYFFVSTNCGIPKTPDHLRSFDEATRCILQSGHPYRYMAEPEILLQEIEGTGFLIDSWEKHANSDWDHLIVHAIKPGAAA